MIEGALNGLMNLLEVRVNAFTVCGISDAAALEADPLSNVVVHLVLKGEGAVEFETNRYPLTAGTVFIVPAGFGKVIRGRGPTTSRLKEEDHCPLQTGLINRRGNGPEADLVIGFAAVEATIGGAIDVFEHLWEPMIEVAADSSLTPVLAMIEQELCDPKVGTQAIVSALMKHVLIAVFRGQIAREAYRSWLFPAMLNPQLGKAALAIMSRPQEPHSVEALAATAGMSRSRFTELFTDSFGRSPIEFLQVVRLRAARRLLASSSLPVKSVAAAVGYASRSHFSRAFQAEYGIPPSEFRSSAEQTPLQSA